MSKQNLLLGKEAEGQAVNFLKQNGYKILLRNFRTRLGEVDIIALNEDVLCFVEVKSRTSEAMGNPAEAVSQKKQRMIAKAALTYIKENKLLDKKARFDVVSVLDSGKSCKITLIKDAFELDGSFTY